MPRDFGLCVVGKDCAGRTADLWILGMLNAIPMFSAGIFGTTLADPLQENFLGRRGSVLISALITVATTIGASATHSVGQLAACRALNGVALGAKASISRCCYTSSFRCWTSVWCSDAGEAQAT
jgi:MFS family permease